MKKNIILTLAATAVLTLTLAPSVNTEAKTKTKTKTISLDSAAKKYVKTANSSANKKSGKTKVTMVVKGKISCTKFAKAVEKVHCKNVKKNTKAAFRDELLCPYWSDYDYRWSKKKTIIKVTFNNKKMHTYSSYGKTNWIEKAEEEVFKDLAVFKKAFGEDTMKKKSQLGAFAVSYVHANEACGSGAYYYDGWTASCAKGVNGETRLGNCQGKANAATRVMRMLGFSYDNCGIVFNYATNHSWNWWKDENGKIYMGDPTDGVGFAGEIDQIDNYAAFICDQFSLPRSVDMERFGIKDDYEWMDFIDKLIQEEGSTESLDVPYSVYSQYCSVEGFGDRPKSYWVERVKNGDDGYASDGKKGTNWKYSKIKFSY